MSTLLEIQKKLQNYLLTGEGNVGSYLVIPPSKILKDRLNIYREGYYLRLWFLLKEDYPTLKRMMGNKIFERIARQYIDAYPSRYYSIRDTGLHFPEFLKKEYPRFPAWAELARFEQILKRLTFEEDPRPLQWEDLQNIPGEQWGELVFHFQPTLRQSFFLYNVDEVWKKALNKEKKLFFKKQEESKAFLLWRKNMHSYFMSINSEQLCLFNALQSGQSFSDVCEKMCEVIAEDEVVAWTAQTLKTWVEEELFSFLLPSGEGVA